jgi:hypothetical protein
MHVQGNVWMIVGPAGNAAVQIGDDGVLVVDTMTEALAGDSSRRFAGSPAIGPSASSSIRDSIPAHIGGNAVVAEAGESIVAGNFVGQVGAGAADSAEIIAHEQVQLRMSRAGDGGQPAVPPAAGRAKRSSPRCTSCISTAKPCSCSISPTPPATATSSCFSASRT